MDLEMITYENTNTIQELIDKSVNLYFDRDILRYELDNVI